MKTILILFIFTSSCSYNSDTLFSKVVLSDKQEKVFSDTTFAYPKMTNYHPLYFGLLKDSIQLNYFIQFVPPPPSNLDSLQLDDDFQYTYYAYEPGEFDKYFLTGCFYKDYLDVDSSETTLFVDTSIIIANAEYSYIPGFATFFEAYPVFIKNISSDTIIIGTGNQIHLQLQAKKNNAEWRDIETPFKRTCGTGLPCMILPKGEYCVSSVIKPQNGVKTKLRLRLGKNYSNEFFGNVVLE